MTEQIYGLFASFDDAEHAVAALKDHGVEAGEVSVVRRTDGSGIPQVENHAEKALTSTSVGDVISGAEKGGAVGLALGILAGAAALAVPGFGLILAAGPLWAAFATAVGATAAGVLGGGVVGFLVDQGLPPETAAHYHDAIARGGILLSVRSLHVSDADAVMLLEKYGATDIASHEPSADLTEKPSWTTEGVSKVTARLDQSSIVAVPVVAVPVVAMPVIEQAALDPDVDDEDARPMPVSAAGSGLETIGSGTR